MLQEYLKSIEIIRNRSFLGWNKEWKYSSKDRWWQYLSEITIGLTYDFCLIVGQRELNV